MERVCEKTQPETYSCEVRLQNILPMRLLLWIYQGASCTPLLHTGMSGGACRARLVLWGRRERLRKTEGGKPWKACSPRNYRQEAVEIRKNILRKLLLYYSEGSVCRWIDRDKISNCREGQGNSFGKMAVSLCFICRCGESALLWTILSHTACVRNSDFRDAASPDNCFRAYFFPPLCHITDIAFRSCPVRVSFKYWRKVSFERSCIWDRVLCSSWSSCVIQWSSCERCDSLCSTCREE